MGRVEVSSVALLFVLGCISFGATALLANEGTAPGIADGISVQPLELGGWVEAKTERPEPSSSCLAVDDFDEDGVKDLVIGARAGGVGTVSIHSGNVDALFPYSARARQRRAAGSFTDQPFPRTTATTTLPDPVDVVGAGDFDNDGHRDVVAASLGARHLVFLYGDGTGAMPRSEVLELPGAVTAMAAGEVDQREGLADLALAVDGVGASQLLIYTGPKGAAHSEPAVIGLPGPARELHINLFDGGIGDIVAVCDAQLVLVRGVGSVTGWAPRIPDRESAIVNLPMPALSVTATRHDDLSSLGLAVLLVDGSVRRFDGADLAALRDGEIDTVTFENRLHLVAEGDGGSLSDGRLVAARVSARPVEDLVVVDRTMDRLEIIGQTAPDHGWPRSERAALPWVEGARDLLPLRLGPPATHHLVVATGDGAAPLMSLAKAARSTFAVDSTADDGDDNPGDGVCATALGTCTLRAAIEEANATTGPHSITFTGLASGDQTFKPSSAIPLIHEPATIDGTTHVDGLVEVDGSGMPALNGLWFDGGNSSVRGLVINRFYTSGLIFKDGEGYVVEGCRIGTDLAGTTALGNGSHGIYATDASLTIGGAIPAAGNLISGNDHGIRVSGNGSSTIQGNLVGTDASGLAPIPNSNDGIWVGQYGAVVGGTGPGEGNVVSGNLRDGIHGFTSLASIQGNLIGLDRSGAAPLGNQRHGILGSAWTIVGGVAANASNAIAFNSADGIAVTNYATIRANTVFSNAGIGIDLNDDGRTPNDPGDSDDGANRLQNFPDLSAAWVDSAGELWIAYRIDSAPSRSTYPLEVEFFEAESVLSGQGKTFLGADTFSETDYSDGLAFVSLGVAVAIAVEIGDPIVATVTDDYSSLPLSSEFSDVVVVGPALFSVNTTDDLDDGTCDGTHCSLREAILLSNLNNLFADTIIFDIPGTAPHTIQLTEALPDVIDTVTIDGTTEPDYAGSPVVVLDGANQSFDGLRILGDDIVVRGLVIQRFSDGIEVLGARNTIQRCFLGTDHTGLVDLRNQTDIRVEDAPETSIGGPLAGDGNVLAGPVYVFGVGSAGSAILNNTVGLAADGLTPLPNPTSTGIGVYSTEQITIGGAGTGNTIAGLSWAGISVGSAEGVWILGNRVGTDVTGTVAVGTGTVGWGSAGIYVSDSNLISVGSEQPGLGNLVSGNVERGITIHTSTSCIVRGNIIGTALDRMNPLPNGTHGIEIQHSWAHVGGCLPGEDNVIAFNGGAGVYVTGGSAQGIIECNSYFFNGGLAIDLAPEGPTANDPLDADVGPNQLQNAPEILGLEIDGSAHVIMEYRVDSDPAHASYDLQVEFFLADSKTSGQGRAFLLEDTYTLADHLAGSKVLDLGPAATLGFSGGENLVATAMSADGNTSEFSAVATVYVGPTVFTVTTTDDLFDGLCSPDHCSLREAITAANSNAPAVDTVAFAVGSGPVSLEIAAPLPALSETVTLDGTTQPGFVDSPIVELNGAEAPSGPGLLVAADNCVIRGLVVNRFPEEGVRIEASSAHVELCAIGTDLDGATALGNGNGYPGIAVVAGANTEIGAAGAGNLISGNDGPGVRLTSADGTTAVLANRIGTDAAGISALPNEGPGILVESPGGVTIGGSDPSHSNIISGNSGAGIELAAPGAVIFGNHIGTDPTGLGAVPNELSGVLDRAGGGFIGGTGPGEANLISGNGMHGVEVTGVVSTTVIAGNWIGLNDAGVGALGNLESGVEIGADASAILLDSNLVSGNARGVRIYGSGNSLLDNAIGYEPGGALAAVGNLGSGVEIIGSQGNLIGQPDHGNHICANQGHGVRLIGAGASQNTLQANSIGACGPASEAWGNRLDGVEIAQGSNNLIGGFVAGAGNVISGNGVRGVAVTRLPGRKAGGIGNTIQGNLIGTDVSGMTARPNGASGIEIDNTPDTLIGGSAPLAGNTISGNGGPGIRVAGGGSAGTVVAGNAIGAGVDGATAVPNGACGVAIEASSANLIGGPGSGDGNQISGNALCGVLLSGSSTVSNNLGGNLIGTQNDGLSPLGNTGPGILVTGQASHNTVGGAVGTTVAFNGGGGILVDSGVGNTVRFARAFGNAGLALDLGGDGVTANDAMDADWGANALQNFPELATATSGAAQTRVTGTLHGAPSIELRVDFYATAACDPLGHGEADVWLGTSTVTTDAQGDTVIDATFGSAVTVGWSITSTATGPDGSTSELSACVPVAAQSDHIFSDGFEDGNLDSWD